MKKLIFTISLVFLFSCSKNQTLNTSSNSQKQTIELNEVFANAQTEEATEAIDDSERSLASSTKQQAQEKLSKTEKVSKIKVANEIRKEYKKLSKEDKKEVKSVLKTVSKKEGKSQLITLILGCIFIVTGIAGIQRFYLGGKNNIIIGIVQLLTLGCCGIWWLIDIIRILTGDLQPEDGYTDRI